MSVDCSDCSESLLLYLVPDFLRQLLYRRVCIAWLLTHSWFSFFFNSDGQVVTVGCTGTDGAAGAVHELLLCWD